MIERGQQRRAAAALLLAALLLAALLGSCIACFEGGGQERGRAAPPVASRDDEAIRLAFRERRSGLMVASVGIVERVLSDDLEGSRHQRFILRLDSGQTLLISHNIDLAPRVPAEPGDAVAFRGQYEWNERGGVIHWTHRDPEGRRPGGWLVHENRTYR